MIFVRQAGSRQCRQPPITPIAFVVAAALIGAASSAIAGSMRCGTSLLSDGKIPGPSMAEVIHKCGEPYDRYRNQWLYVRGEAVYRVYFNENGNVRRITSEIVR